MKRAVIYRRVSKATETNIGGSLEDQLGACKARAAAEGWVLTPDFDYLEAGRSAYNEKPERRPVFQQLLADAKAGRFDVVLVYKYDRFSRKMMLGLQARHLLNQAGVEIISVSEPFDERTAAGRYSVRNMLNMAELFSDMLGERIRARRQSEASAGRHLGHAPTGYTYAGGHGQRTRHAPYDGLVVQALQLYADGQLSTARIAQSLNDQGYTMPSGKALTAEDVRRFVENARLYNGQVRAGGTWITGQHEAIIDDDLCRRVLAAFERRSRQQRRFARTQETTALLAGLCFCDACRRRGVESKMHYHIDRRSAEPWRAFRCKQRADNAGCATPYALAAPIEAQVLALCDLLALPADWYTEALAMAAAQLGPVPKTPTLDRGRVEDKIRRLSRLYADGLKTDDEYVAELASLRAQINTLPAAPVPRVTVRQVAALLSDLPALIRQGTVAEQRAALSEVFDQFYIMQDRLVAVRPTGLYAALVEAAGSATDVRH